MTQSPIQSHYLAIDNEFGRVDGVLRRGARPSSTVVLQTHPRLPSDQNLTVWPMEALPLHGIDTFAYNNRYANSTAGTELITVWEDIALDVAAAVAEMRRLGYRHVILYGFSAGGPTVVYYQHVAERGNAAFNGGATLSGFTGFLADGRERRLPPVDGLVLQNGTTGTGYSFLARLDGSVVDEATARRDPELDPFEPANGYDPETGAAAYAPGFLRRYYRAQALRMNRLIDEALARREDVLAGRARFLEDELMTIAGIRAEPASIDLRLSSATRDPWPVHPDGRAAIARSDRAVVPGYRRRNLSFRDGGTVHTLRSFLSYRAVRVDPDRFDPEAARGEDGGVDLTSVNSTTAACLAGTTVPLLVTAGTADTQVHLPHAEMAYHAAARTADRTIAIIGGAEHDMSPAGPGAGDTRAAHLDVLAAWIRDRFLDRYGSA